MGTTWSAIKAAALKIDHGSERLALDLRKPKESIEGAYLRRMEVPAWLLEELIRARIRKSFS
jgi:hypothetical protein